MKFLQMLQEAADQQYQPGNLVVLRKVSPNTADDEDHDEWESNGDKAVLIYSPKYSNDNRGFIMFIKDLIDYVASGQHDKDTYGEEDFHLEHGDDADSYYNGDEATRVIHQYIDDGFLSHVDDDKVDSYLEDGIQMIPLGDNQMHATSHRAIDYDPIENPPGNPDWSEFGATSFKDFASKMGSSPEWQESAKAYRKKLAGMTPEERAEHQKEADRQKKQRDAEFTANAMAPHEIKKMKAGATAQTAIQKAMQSSKKGKFGEGVKPTINKESDMKFLRSLMEAAKPEAEKSPISKGDQRAYTSQVKTTFKGDEKFKTGKVSRSKFAAAAMDAIDNCPKNGNCDEKHKSACVKAMWSGYRAKFDGVKDGVITEGWDDMMDSDEDVKTLDKEIKKNKLELSASKEDDVKKNLKRFDKKSEDKSVKKTLKEYMDSDEDPDVKAADYEAKKSGAKVLSPRAEKALHRRLEKGDKKAEDTSAKKAKEKSKEEVKESVQAVEPKEVVKGGFADFMKQK